MRLTCLLLTIGIGWSLRMPWEERMQEASELERLGRYSKAKQAYLLALQDEEAKEDAASAGSRFRQAITWNNLALVNRNLGVHSDARKQYQRALALFEEVRGPGSPELANSMHDLAVLDYLDGQLDDAARGLRSALQIREAVLGASHPATAQTLNSLSAVYASQRRIAEAERFCRKALAIQEQALGTEHPQVSDTLDNLASIYRAQGELETALETSLRSQQIAQRAYGDSHPVTCRRGRKVAVLYGNLGRFSEAEPLLRSILEIQTRVLGPENPDVAATLANLAAVCFHRRLLDDAEALYGRAQAILERTDTNRQMFGAILSDHAWLLRSAGKNSEARKLDARADAVTAAGQSNWRRFTVDVNDLLPVQRGGNAKAVAWEQLNGEGNRLREQGGCRESIRILVRARAAAAEQLGPDNPSVAIPANNLATAYVCVGEFTRAERYSREALLLSGGRSPVDRAGILNNHGIILMSLNRTKEAEDALKEALSIHETVDGGLHPSTAAALTSLGVLRVRRGQYTEARQLFRRSLAIWEARPGDEIRAATVLNNLGVVSLYLREYEESTQSTTRALEIVRRLLPPDHPEIARCLHNYAVALDKLGMKKPARTAFQEAASARAAFSSKNLTGLTVDVRALNRK